MSNQVKSVKKQVICKTKCSYGEKGEVIEMSLPGGELTERQKVMLAFYEKPTVKVDDSDLKKQVKELQAENESLKKEVEQLKAKPSTGEDKK